MNRHQSNCAPSHAGWTPRLMSLESHEAGAWPSPWHLVAGAFVALAILFIR